MQDLCWFTRDPCVGNSAFAGQLAHTRSDAVIAQFFERDKSDHGDALILAGLLGARTSRPRQPHHAAGVWRAHIDRVNRTRDSELVYEASGR